MGAPLSIPRRLLSVEEYCHLGEAGVLGADDRVELIEGEMIEMTPVGGPHVYLVNELNLQFSAQLGEHGIVSVQNPLVLPPRNLPEPDLVILKPSSRKSRNLPTAQDVLLLIEVSHSSLEYDREVKIPIYARYGIPEVWQFDVESEKLSIYLQPTLTGYKEIRIASGDDVVSPSLLPTVKIDLNTLW